MLLQSKQLSPKNKEGNQLKYISTYKMGQIGITKLIEEPYKSSLNSENNLPSQQIQINKVPSNINTNTNNTNSNTNTNTFKAIDNNSNKKILKNHHSASHNVIHIQSNNNFNCYKKSKNKSNQRINLINIKNEKNKKLEAVKINKNEFSKTTHNLCLYMKDNSYNKNNYKNSFSKNRIKSKSNSKIQSEAGYSNYILSSRTPSSIKRNQKKYAISNLIGNIKNETNINSFKKDNIFDLDLKTSNNKSCKNIYKKNEKVKEDINYETKYQITEFNTYLKVRKREDIQSQKHAKSNLKTESNKLLSSCILNNEKKKIESSNIKDNNYLSDVLSTEDNINGKPNIKIIKDENKNINRLFTESNQKHNNLFANIENNNINNNRNIHTSKNNFYNNKRKNQSKTDLNKNNFETKTFSQTKNIKNNISNKKMSDNRDINNFNKNKINNIDKKKKSHKTRYNYSMNNSKKHILKETNNKENNKKDNIRYNSFVKIDKNVNINYGSKKNNNVKMDKDKKFECPEELHFFMVNLTHNYIHVNSKF